MGLFKKKHIYDEEPLNSFDAPMNALEDGDLPWGWVTHNSDFIEKTEMEFNYFRERWVAVKDKDPKAEYEALKSLIKYMEDIQEHCDKKGECFSLWCSDYLLNPEWRLKLGMRFVKLEEKLSR